MRILPPARVLQIQLEEDLGLKSELEYFFHEGRGWRFDLAVLDAPTPYLDASQNIGVEIDGGNFKVKGGRGAHARGVGQRKDREKQNAATIDGWKVLRYDPDEIERGDALRDIRRLIENGV